MLASVFPVYTDFDPMVLPYGPQSLSLYFRHTRLYERMCRDFERFVEARSPRLAPLARALMREFTKSEYSRSSGVSTSSVSRQADKLKALVEEFLESESYL